MNKLHKAILLLEVFLCFTPAAMLLAFGVWMAIVQLALLDQPVEGDRGLMFLFLMLIAGCVGLITLAHAVSQLLRQNGSIAHPLLVLFGVLIAVTSLVPLLFSGMLLFVLVALLALLSTAHVLFLARRLLEPLWNKIYVGSTCCVLAIVGSAAVYAAIGWTVVTEEEALERELYAPPRTVELSPREQTSLDELVVRIARASRESYDSGDWSTFAALYPPGTFECWNASGAEHRFGFLSRRGMPDSAHYTIIDRRDYHDSGGVLDVDNFNATHVLMISYETAAFQGCAVRSAKLWPQEHFYVTRLANGFELAHPCPSRDQVDTQAIARTWPVVTRAHAMTVAKSLSAAEREEVREMIRKDNFPLRATGHLARQHGLSEAQATQVLDAICGLSE